MYGALTGVHKRPAAPSEVYTRCHTSFKAPLVSSYPLTNISIPSFLSAVHEKKENKKRRGGREDKALRGYIKKKKTPLQNPLSQ